MPSSRKEQRPQVSLCQALELMRKLAQPRPRPNLLLSLSLNLSLLSLSLTLQVFHLA